MGGVLVADLDDRFHRTVETIICRAAGQGWPASTSEEDTPHPTVHTMPKQNRNEKT